MTDNSKQKVYNKIAKVQDIGYAMNCTWYCILWYVCVVLTLETIQISAQHLLMSVLLTLSIKDAFRGHRLPVHL